MDGEQQSAADEQSDHQPEAGQDDLQGERPDAAAASGTDPETEALPAPEPRAQKTSNGLPTEEIIGWILRVGVAASAICIALGALLLLVSHDTGYGNQSFSNAGQLLQYSSGAGGRFPT